MPGAEWYYVENGAQAGPLSLEDLIAVINRKGPDTPVFGPDMLNWVEAQVAMGRFRGVDIDCGSTGGRHRRRPFAANMTGFAHAGDDDAATRCENRVAGCDE